MKKIESIFKLNPGESVWGSDWTKNFDPEQEVLGTILLDPKKNPDYKLHESDFELALNRPPLVVDNSAYQGILEHLGIPTSEAVCIHGTAVLTAHNEGTKFGSRKVIAVTPVVVDKTRFVGHEDLMPYFVLEQDLQMKTYLPQLTNGLDGGSVNGIFQAAKTQTMETALFNGQLPAYLQFHDQVYKPGSANQQVREHFQMKEQAKKGLENKYRGFQLAWVSNLLELAGRPKVDELEQWKEKQHKTGYSPHRLKVLQ